MKERTTHVSGSWVRWVPLIKDVSKSRPSGNDPRKHRQEVGGETGGKAAPGGPATQQITTAGSGGSVLGRTLSLGASVKLIPR